MKINECTSLLPAVKGCSRDFDSSNALSNFRKHFHFCIRSKAVFMILLWNFSVLLLYKTYDVTTFLQFDLTVFPLIFYAIIFTVISVFAPMAGLLTDVKFSRYKAVLCSTYSIVIEVSLVLILTILGSIISFTKYDAHENIQKNPFIITGYICGVIVLITLISFIINGFQFGVDQLHDFPTKDFILFIHWYVWLYYASTFLGQFILNLLFYDERYVDYVDNIRLSGLVLAGLFFLVILVLLILSLTVVHSNKQWFHIEPAGVNPYKLVYMVVKFAFHHKVPLRRSAFTYCEDEFPSRLDLGKHKYGGPFTTKQVEDVKAFWGILKVLICIGPTFMLQIVNQSILLVFSQHNKLFVWMKNETTGTVHHEIHLEKLPRHIFISNGLLSPLLVTICIPLYLCLIRPHLSYHIPGMLKRIGLGIVLMIVSLLTALGMDVAVHAKDSNVPCMFHGLASGYNKTETISKLIPPPFYQNVYFFTVEHIISALANMLIDIAVLEFVCSQSPYSVKGLLLGSYFSIKSIFQGCTLLSLIPFGLSWHAEILSCGSGFYLMNVVIGLLELALFIFVAKKYKYRTVNEPYNEYLYAEAYYSNIQ